VLAAFVPAQASQTPMGVVTGVLWLDEDEHGVRQPGDPVLPNAPVQGWRSILPGGAGRSVGSITTDADGRFLWSLPAGSTYWLAADFEHFTDRDTSGLGSLCALTATVQPGVTQQVDVRVVPRRGITHPLSLPLTDGYFFKQGTLRGSPGVNSCDSGFSVTNEAGIWFWDTFRRFGPENLGWPISVRFEHEGQILQVFERAVLVWRQAERRVAVLDVMDELHARGQDERRSDVGLAPPALEWDGSSHDPEVVAERLALLDTEPAIRERYFAVDDPIALYGLPTSAAEMLYPRRSTNVFETDDSPRAVALRTQKTVFYLWLQDVPLLMQPLAAGQVGEINTAQAGLYVAGPAVGWFPRDVFVRQPVPVGTGPNIPLW
jgi:hypothetical protein